MRARVVNIVDLEHNADMNYTRPLRNFPSFVGTVRKRLVSPTVRTTHVEINGAINLSITASATASVLILP